MKLGFVSAIALLVGLFNGLFVGSFEIPSFIVTLASMSILQGLILILSASQSVIIDDPVLKVLGAGKFLGLPVLLWYTAFVVVLVWAILEYTRFGSNVYAIGSNIHAARVSGMNVARQQIKIFLFSALFTSLASVALATRVSVVSPSLGAPPSCSTRSPPASLAAPSAPAARATCPALWWAPS